MIGVNDPTWKETIKQKEPTITELSDKVKKDIIENFRDQANIIFDQGLINNRTEKDSTTLIMDLFGEMLREKNLYHDLDFMVECQAVIDKIHSAHITLQRSAEPRKNIRERLMASFKLIMNGGSVSNPHSPPSREL